MKRMIAIAVLSSLVVTGCMRPLPVREPTPSELTGFQAAPSLLSSPRGLDEARHQLLTYAAVYMDEARKRMELFYKGSDAAMGGGLIGAIGGLTKSPETAVAGVLLSAGGSIPEQRYQMRVQADNYAKAADAMRCLERTLATENQSGSYSSEIDLINKHLDRVRVSLRNRQYSIVPAAVDTAAYTDALKKELEARNALDADMDKSRGVSLTDAQRTAEQLKELDAKLGQCSATI